MNNDLISRSTVIEILQAKADMAVATNAQMVYLNAARMVEKIRAVDAEPVQHGRWMLEAHDERVNYRWNVTAECSECCNGQTEIWAGFFPITPGCIAKDIALQSAAEVKLSNYCPNCGAKMDGGAKND